MRYRTWTGLLTLGCLWLLAAGCQPEDDDSADDDTTDDDDDTTDDDDDTATGDPIEGLQASCEIYTIDVDGEMEAPEDNLSAIVTCQFENVGSEELDLADVFPGVLWSHPAGEQMDASGYLNRTSWNGIVAPGASESNDYSRENAGYVSGMGSSDEYVITVTITDEAGRILEVITPPAEAGWAA